MKHFEAKMKHFEGKMYLQKAPGQDLAKNGRFPMIPEKKFKSQQRGRQMAEMKNFETKNKHFEAKLKHFEAKNEAF